MTPAVVPADPGAGMEASDVPVDLFVSGEFVRGEGGTPRTVGKVPKAVAAGPPLRVGGTVHVVVGPWGDPQEWWQVDHTARAVRAAEHVTGMAADAGRLAYGRAETTDGALYARGSVVVRATDGSEHVSPPQAGPVFVLALLGDQVLVRLGDGVPTLAVYDPEEGFVGLEGLRNAHAAHGPTRQVVVQDGDGPCWRLVRLPAGGPPEPGALAECSGPESARFSPAGDLLAVVAGSGGGGDNVVVHAVTGGVRGSRRVEGARQVTWLGERVVVLADTGTAQAALVCDVSLRDCRRAWSGTARQPAPESLWLVEVAS